MSLHKSWTRSRVACVSLSLGALLLSTAAEAQQNKPASTSSDDAQGEEVVVLSPFVIDASKDQGYYAENTLAGSRLNTRLSDLGPSISVITKQLLEDTASTDINDIFRYEINTEGSLTYTPSVQSFRSDGVTDVNSGVSLAGSSIQTNTSANRVRGLGSPTTAINYYSAVNRVPMDSYNVSSVEINRGPNSMLFGMGSPAGIVNQTTAVAMLTRNTNTLSARIDSLGSVRTSFSFNRALIKDKLAFYGAALLDERRFERKPSYDNTRRLYGALTFKPFKSTTIRANAEFYRNDNRRPNTLTPRDFVTEWVKAGKPMYNALNRTVTASGQVQGVYVTNASSPFAQSVRDFIATQTDYDASKWNAAKTTYNGISIFGDAAMTNTGSILYAPGIFFVNKGRSIQQIADGQLVNWFIPLLEQTYRTAYGTATDPSANAPLYPTTSAIWANSTWSDIYNRGFTSSGGWSGPTLTIGGYKYPGVTDKSIYNWEDVNINQMNFGSDKNRTYNVELEQKLLENLHLNAGWFRQNYESKTNFTVAQLNVATLLVDTNQYLPDGTPNPMAGKVYVEDQDADQGLGTEDHDQYRVMLAYTPDFTRNTGWTKWLGKHQILGLYSGQESTTSYIRRRLVYVDTPTAAGKYRFLPNPNNKADGSPTGWNYGLTGHRRTFYLAGPNDPAGTVTRSSGEWNHESYTGDITVYDYATSQFQKVNVTENFIDTEPNTMRNQRQLKSVSGGMTNYLWKDRVITTFGVRRDVNKTRTTTGGALLTGYKGTQIEPALANADKWVNGEFQTAKIFNRWNYWDKLAGSTHTMGGVFKPFKNWSDIERRANNGSLAWGFVRDFGLSYNTSNNFNAPEATQVDAFGKPLPKPEGEGKDYGFQFTLFDGKLFARLTWFEGSNENERVASAASAAIGRLTGNIDTTLFRNWARTIALINRGHDPLPDTFGQSLSAAEETEVQNATAAIWKQPYNYYGDVGTITATRNAEAEGMELQLTYNPLPNWTMRLTAGKQVTVYSKVLKEFDAWYDYRNPVWTAAKAADYLLPQYKHLATYTRASSRQVDLTTFWGSYGYTTEIRNDEPSGNYNAQLYFNNVVLPQVAQNRDLEGQAAPGQRRYRWSLMNNYSVPSGRFKGFSFGGVQRWEDRAIIGYLGRSSGLNTNPAYLDMSDISKPVYDEAHWYTDLWCAYSRKIFKGKVNMKVQLNVDNIFEDGGLRVTAVNYDGSPYAFRIIDSRSFKLTTTFDF